MDGHTMHMMGSVSNESGLDLVHLLIFFVTFFVAFFSGWVLTGATTLLKALKIEDWLHEKGGFHDANPKYLGWLMQCQVCAGFFPSAAAAILLTFFDSGLHSVNDYVVFVLFTIFGATFLHYLFLMLTNRKVV